MERISLKRLIVLFIAMICFSSFFFINKSSANEIPAVDWISIIQEPSKTVYSNGEDLDLSDMILEGFYYDGTKILITDYEISYYNPDQLGEQDIVIAYQNRSTSLKISILPAKIENVSIVQQDATSVTLKWNKIYYNRYEVYSMDYTTGVYKLEATTYDENITLYYPSSATRSYKIRAIFNIYGKDYVGDFSEPFIIATKPDAVTGLRFVNNTATEISLSWDEIPEATGYLIYRSLSTTNDYAYSGTTEDSFYTDRGLVAGCNYKYKVSAYVLNDTYEGELSSEIEAYTNLNKVTLNYKPGDEKVRLSWTKVTNATYYDVFIQEEESEVEFLTTIEGKTNSYIVEGLSIGENYYFYIAPRRLYNNVIYDGPLSNTVQVALDEIAATSTAAKLFANKKAFQESLAYLEIDSFSKNVKYGKSFPLPGLITTNINGFSSTRMCPQGITFAEDYILLTAYDMAGEENSVIYVVHKDTNELLTTLVLPNKNHVGGISFDGVNVWISNGTRVSSILFSDVEEAAEKGDEYSLAQYATTSNALGISASYITYYDDKLWIGSYNELKSTRMFSYDIEDKDNKPYLVKEDTIIMPTRVQGLAFTDDGVLIMSRSCQLYQGLRGYMRQIDVYEPAFNMKSDEGIIPLGESVNTLAMPSMGEGIAIEGSYLYMSFESAVFDTASYQMDRVCAFKTSAILSAPLQ